MIRAIVFCGLALLAATVPAPAHAQNLDTVLAQLFGVQPATTASGSRWRGIERYQYPTNRSRRHHRRGVDSPVAPGHHRIMGTYYGGGERLSSHTASGERFVRGGLTAAHRTLPFGTRLHVTNPRTGRSVIVRVNDRGPFRRGYSLDLAAGAARAIGFTSGALDIHPI